MEELEAKSRQVFDSIRKIFDDRKRRVTDLKECARVTLPKALETQDEALIEMLRNTVGMIYNDKEMQILTRKITSRRI